MLLRLIRSVGYRRLLGSSEPGESALFAFAIEMNRSLRLWEPRDVVAIHDED